MSVSKPLIMATDKAFDLAPLVQCVLSVCGARGVKETQLLSGTGIFIDDVLCSKRLSISQISRLFTNARKLTPGNDCSFQIGHQLIRSGATALIRGAHYTESMRELLKIIMRHAQKDSPFLSAKCFINRDYTFLALEQRTGCEKNLQFIIEVYCTALVALSKSITGKRVPFHFSFTSTKPHHIAEYQANLGRHLKFSQPLNMIACSQYVLNTTSLLPNKTLKQRHLQIYSKQQNKLTLIDALRRYLRHVPYATLADAAKYFQTSPATLKRRLKQASLSFKQCQDEVQLMRAIDLLLVKGLNNEQSAKAMEYSDLTNFRRSIKRWTGLTPQQLRASVMF